MKILGRILAFVAFASALLVAGNLAMMLRVVLADAEAWDGGRGLDALYLALGVFGGGALMLALVALPAFIGVFVGPRSRGTALWFLTLPGIFGLVGAAAIAGVLAVLQPDGARFMAPVAGPIAGPALVALVAGILSRSAARPPLPGGQSWPGQPPGQPWPPQQYPPGQWPAPQLGQPWQQPPPQPPSAGWPPPAPQQPPGSRFLASATSRPIVG